MQIDFHYYGTYCLARAAGIKRKSAQTIAYASQYVDDSTTYEIETNESGSKIVTVATAHHVTDIRNLDDDDQRQIWVPFHFFPGGQGKTWTEKLVCRKNSSLAKEMVNYNLRQDKSYMLQLIGVTAHVYADTFAHYGFSGISSRRNRIDGSTIKIDKSHVLTEQIFGDRIAKWFDKYGSQGGLLKNIRSFASATAELTSGALGHGGVAIYPDQPYLKWSFEYEFDNLTKGKLSIRDNKRTFMEASKNLHKMFRIFALAHSNHRDDNSYVPFNDLKKNIKKILKIEADKNDRIEIWKEYARTGKLYNKKETIPLYNKNVWEDQKNAFTSLTSSEDVAKMGVYKFYQAASFHKHHVLRELLPNHGIIII